MNYYVNNLTCLITLHSESLKTSRKTFINNNLLEILKHDKHTCNVYSSVRYFYYQ